MASVNYEKLVGNFSRDFNAAAVGLRASFKAGELSPRDFNLGRLFEACFGWEEFRQCQEKRTLASDVYRRHGGDLPFIQNDDGLMLLSESVLKEADGAVSTASFQNISGQIVYTSLLEPYEDEDFVFQKLIPEEQISNGTIDGEKIAGINPMGDEVQLRNENQPYAVAGVSEDWIFAPASRDRGVVVPVTWEAVFADRTGRLLENCSSIGTDMARNKEKRAIDCVIDENTTAHRHNWRGTVIASYGDNSGSHTWDNLAASNALVDWTDIDAAEQVFNGITHPYTGEPVMIEPKHLIAVKALERTASRILSATEIRVATPGYAVSANPTQTVVANPYLNKYTWVTSRLLASRLATDTTWFIGDISKAFRYRVAEKANVVTAPAGNEADFHRRIVQQYRVNEHGAYYTVNPRYMVTCTA
jgi:hypothetical protein